MNPDPSPSPSPADPHHQAPPAGGCCGGCGAPRPSRRDFMLWIAIGLNVIAAALISIPILGYILSAFFQRGPQSWILLGPVSQFPEGQTRLAVFKNPFTRPWDGTTDQIPCWVRHIQGDDFQVFAINCTHLGCPVRWFQESRLFMCPCHGGVYYEDGTHASGPPPRPLYQYKYKVEQGQLWVWGGQIPTLANPV